MKAACWIGKKEARGLSNMEISGKNLTVIVPSFNMQELMERAVASVVDSSPDITVLVIDDASDPPVHLPDHGNIHLVKHASNRGASSARNTGIEHATTPWLSFLDADDVWLPGSLDERLAFVNRHLASKDWQPDMLAKTIFGCGWLEEASHGASARARIPKPASTLTAFASGCWYCPGSAIIAHRNVFDGQQEPYSPQLRRLEDFEWGLRFGKQAGRLLVHDEAGVSIKPSNRVSFHGVENAANEIVQLHQYLKAENPDAWRSMQAYLELEKATAAWRDQSRLRAVSSLLASYWHRPRVGRHLSPGWTYRSAGP